MDSVVACALCGMDPAADTMLINTAIAAGIGAPWMLRHQIIGFARRGYRRLRGIEPDPEACPLPEALDADDPDLT
jgi:hypothetical protein